MHITVCKQTSPTRWFGNMNMTSTCDDTNSAHQLQMTTMCHWMKSPSWKFSACATALNSWLDPSLLPTSFHEYQCHGWPSRIPTTLSSYWKHVGWVMRLVNPVDCYVWVMRSGCSCLISIWWKLKLILHRAGHSRCGADARLRRGTPVSSGFYNVIVFSQPCCDLFRKWPIWITKSTVNYWSWSVCRWYHKIFFLFGGAWA